MILNMTRLVITMKRPLSALGIPEAGEPNQLTHKITSISGCIARIPDAAVLAAVFEPGRIPQTSPCTQKGPQQRNVLACVGSCLWKLCNKTLGWLTT